MILNESLIYVYHGGARWDSHPQIRPSRPGRYECGPGIYTTTSAQTAQKYAKGPGVITLIGIDPGVTLLEDFKISAKKAQDFVASLSRVTNRAEIIETIDRAASRIKNPDGMVCASLLLNAFVNARALGGQNGVELARWYAQSGIDASLYRANGMRSWEDWLIVFNPEIILSYEVQKPADIDWTNPQLPDVKDQMHSLCRHKQERMK